MLQTAPLQPLQRNLKIFHLPEKMYYLNKIIEAPSEAVSAVACIHIKKSDGNIILFYTWMHF